MSINDLKNQILELKRKSDVTILAHYYQNIEIQEIADYLGDSLGLCRIAKEKANTEFIIFAGVDFMVETASIINPNKRILIPNPESCCPMASYLTAKDVKQFKRKYPNMPVIVYVNSSAEVKAEADICCTSSNSIKIAKRMQNEFDSDGVLFGPDANLAGYVEDNSKVKTIKMPEVGHCVVHTRLKSADIKVLKDKHPSAKILVHPECEREVRQLADIVGSTAQMYSYIRDSPSHINQFIIGTEKGLLERMRADYPDNKYYLANENMICYNMKKHNLEFIKYLLENPDNENFEIKVPKDIAERALTPIKRMLEYSQ